MTISVALCTYNGARFLQEQLDSIATQTLQPDEVIVCDDASQDETVSILQNFADHMPFPVHLFINEYNRGITKNFEKAVSLCTGDIIAFCDQDDVWLPEKLSRFRVFFDTHPEAGFVFTDAYVVDQALQPMAGQLWEHVHFTHEKQRAMESGKSFQVQLACNYITGATAAFRAPLKEIALPIPEDTMLIHDSWMALMAAAVGQLAFIPEPLIKYRQHPDQEIGIRTVPKASPIRPRSHFEIHRHQLQTIRDRVSPLIASSSQMAGQIDELNQSISHLDVRLNLPHALPKRIPIVLRELISRRYQKYSNGWKSVVSDLYSAKVRE